MIMRIRLGRQADRPELVARLWSPGDKRLSSGRRLDMRGDGRRTIMSFLIHGRTLYNSICSCKSHLVYDSVAGVVGFKYI
jgi:hypothetical protein